MNQSKGSAIFHIQAILVSVIWGTTFVSSKVLITHGLTPAQIMLIRFFIAYVCIWFISPRKLWSNSIKDELYMLGLGLTGGSLYFLAENTALEFTQASNVSIIISVTPLLTAIAASIVYKSEKINKMLYWGATISLLGIIFVVLNGHFILKLSPLGDILTLIASIMWVIYGIILKKLQQGGYSSAFITRKVFIYGILTILPSIYFGPEMKLSILCDFTVISNFIFLGIIASFLCFLSWNYVVNKIGVITATNYLYLNPLATLITSAIVLQERITIIAILGGVMILSGVYLSQKKNTVSRH